MFDLRKIKETYFLTDEAFAELANLFILDINKDRNNLSEAIYKSDFPLINFTAHKLKSAFRYFFMDEIVELLSAIQLEAKNENLEKVNSAFVQFSLSSQIFIDDIQKYKKPTL